MMMMMTMMKMLAYCEIITNLFPLMTLFFVAIIHYNDR